MNSKKVLIVGSFLRGEGSLPTQAMELAKVLSGIRYTVLTVSNFKNKLLRLLDIIFYILRHNRKFDVGIVQFYSGNSLVWQYVACRLIKWFNKKLIITIHGGAVPERIERYPGRYLGILRKADVITSPSTYMIHRLEKFGITPVLIENSIPLEQYPFIEKKEIKPVLFWMRAFSDIYNPAMAVRVVAQLKKSYPAVKMYMAGPDLGMLAAITQLINELGLNDNIELVGQLDLKGKIAMARKADIYISTNRIDNAPVTFIEMWVMGLPVVSTNAGGIPYLIKDGRNGLLVNLDDDIAMAEKVVELISNPSFAKWLIENARQQVVKYGSSAVFEKWNQLLTQL